MADLPKGCSQFLLHQDGTNLTQPHSKPVWRVKPLCFARTFAGGLGEEQGEGAESCFAL